MIKLKRIITLTLIGLIVIGVPNLAWADTSEDYRCTLVSSENSNVKIYECESYVDEGYFTVTDEERRDIGITFIDIKAIENALNELVDEFKENVGDYNILEDVRVEVYPYTEGNGALGFASAESMFFKGVFYGSQKKIVIFDSIFRDDLGVRTALHEVGHMVDRKYLDVTKRKEFYDLKGGAREIISISDPQEKLQTYEINDVDFQEIVWHGKNKNWGERFSEVFAEDFRLTFEKGYLINKNKEKIFYEKDTINRTNHKKNVDDLKMKNLIFNKIKKDLFKENALNEFEKIENFNLREEMFPILKELKNEGVVLEDKGVNHISIYYILIWDMKMLDKANTRAEVKEFIKNNLDELQDTINKLPWKE